YFQLKTVEQKRSISGYFITLVAVMILAYFAYSTFLSNEYLITRLNNISLETGEGTSGRNFIYQAIFDAWYNSDSIWHIMFGFGFAGSIQLSGGVFAHNDWLELLSNFG